VNADVKIGDADPSKYDALVIPGGQINPDLLRVNDEAMKIVRAFLNDGTKVVAAVCHTPWVLVQAGAVQGLQLTSYHSIRKDVENAGGKWIDREAVVDRGIVTSRNPDDLEAFSKTIIQEVEKDGQKRQPMAA
jgi:protease I